MGCIIEPQNVDLIVGPSVLTEDIKNDIAHAIALYRKTGKKPNSGENGATDSAKETMPLGRKKSVAGKSPAANKRKAKV